MSIVHGNEPDAQPERAGEYTCVACGGGPQHRAGCALAAARRAAFYARAAAAGPLPTSLLASAYEPPAPTAAEALEAARDVVGLARDALSLPDVARGLVALDDARAVLLARFAALDPEHARWIARRTGEALAADRVLTDAAVHAAAHATTTKQER